MRSPEENFISCLKRFHGIEATKADIEVLYHEQNLRNEQERKLKILLGEPIGEDHTAGGIGKIIVGTALGFVSGGFLGAGLALLGGIASALNKPPEAKTREEKRYFTEDGFDSAPSLTPRGGAIPMLWGNRDIDPNGGVRVSGYLDYARIQVECGRSYLYEVYTLGLGPIERIDLDGFFFNEQPRNNFAESDIKTYFRKGTPNQTPLPPEEFPHYSQVVTLSDNNLFGIDRRAEVANIGEIRILPDENLIKTEINGTTVTGNPEEGWDAGFFGAIATEEYLEVVPNGSGNFAFGLSNTNQDTSWVSISHGFLITPSTASVVEDGVVRGDIALGTIYRVEVEIDGNLISFLIDGVIVYHSATTPVFPLYPDIAFATPASLEVTTDTEPTGLSTAQRTRREFRVENDDEIDLLKTSDNYIRCGDVGEQVFRIVEKFHDGDRVIIEPAIADLDDDDELFAIETCRYETTKRVTQIGLNFRFNLSARDKDDGELVKHGTLFDLYLAPVGEELVQIQRFFVKSKHPSPIRRSFTIENLPLGRYYLELVPICEDQGGFPTLELYDDCHVIRVGTQKFIFGKEVFIQGDMSTDPDQINSSLSYDDKTQVSSEQGYTGQLVTVNEIVELDAIGVAPGENNYPGISKVAFRYLASPTQQNPPNSSSLVWRARQGYNCLIAGEASSLSSGNTLVSFVHNFLDTGMEPLRLGMVVRNLTKKIQSPITNFTGNTIETKDPLHWEYRDRFLVYFRGASPYFSDVFTDTVVDKVGGMGSLIDADRFLDFPSLVNSRKHSFDNRYFWNGGVYESTNWIEWATLEARGSLLFPLRLDGRFGLIPEAASDHVAVFNESVATNFTTTYITWAQRLPNTVLVTYTDGRDDFTQDGIRFRPKTITIQTLAAYEGRERQVEESIELRNVTNPRQATDVGCTYLQSKRIQDRNINFSTGHYGFYLQAGDLVLYQHSHTNYQDEISGYIVQANAWQNNTQEVKLSCNYLLYFGEVLEVGSNTFTSNADFTAIPVEVGDYIRNLRTGQDSLISFVSSDTLSTEESLGMRPGDCFEIYNLTLSDRYKASATKRENGNTYKGLNATPFLLDKEVWLRITNLPEPLERLDPINLGKDYLETSSYKVLKIDLSKNQDAPISVEATKWNESILSKEGLVVLVDDEVFFY